MKNLILVAMALVFIIAGGCQGTKVCQCPAEVIYVGTEAGLIRFDVGELDEEHDYIMTEEKVKEFLEEMKREYQKLRGGAL